PSTSTTTSSAKPGPSWIPGSAARAHSPLPDRTAADMPPAAASDALAAHWLAETVRLREAHWGPQEDADAVRQALRQGGSFEDRVLTRARMLGERAGLPATLRRWRHAAWATL